MSKKIGYIRVSTADQNVDRQIDQMNALGMDKIYVEKASGKNFDRPKYKEMKNYIREGDVLYIHSLDRFGRNKQEILNEWNEITKELMVDIIVIDMPLLDTTKHKDSLGTFISDLVLQILSWIAEEERNKILTRQAEGIAAAKSRGKHLGRPKAVLPGGFEEVYNKWKNNELLAVDAMKVLNLTKSTFYKLVKQFEGGNKL